MFRTQGLQTASKKDTVISLKKNLLPIAELTTPNIHEAQEISGIMIETMEDAIEFINKIKTIEVNKRIVKYHEVE